MEAKGAVPIARTRLSIKPSKELPLLTLNGHPASKKTPLVMVRCLSSESWTPRSEMTDTSPANSASASSIPADDPGRVLTVADPDGAGVPHISVAGGTYTILVSGAQTAGRYCLVDMLVPAGGGPPPHRHDFEEMFSLLEGELEFTFRGKSHTVRAGPPINVPANAPHAFKNVSGKTARML